MIFSLNEQVDKLVDYINRTDLGEVYSYCSWLPICKGKSFFESTSCELIILLCADGAAAADYFYYEDWLYDNGYETDEQQIDFLKIVGVL